MVSEFGQNNRIPRNEFDDYPTPAPFVDALLEREKFTGRPWDPCAGSGHLVHRLRRHGMDAYGDDLQHDGFDFLSDHGRTADSIITNPPYKHAIEFVEKSLDAAQHQVAMLVKATFLEGTTRYNRLFSTRPPSRVYITTRRMTPAGKGGGGAFAHAWLVWDLQNPVSEGGTTLAWFTPKGSIIIPSGGPE